MLSIVSFFVSSLLQKIEISAFGFQMEPLKKINFNLTAFLLLLPHSLFIASVQGSSLYFWKNRNSHIWFCHKKCG